MLLLSGWRLSIGTPWNDQKTFYSPSQKAEPRQNSQILTGFLSRPDSFPFLSDPNGISEQSPRGFGRLALGDRGHMGAGFQGKPRREVPGQPHPL